MPNRGYVYVASCNKAYYKAAKISAQSLLDFYPEANITLFTHAGWVEEEDYKIFQHIITEDVPVHIRAKLWALSKTPYDETLYIDCDTMIQDDEISLVFDHLGDNDILFTRNRPYNAKITKLSETEEMIYHCGLVLYRKNEKTCKLMDDWYEGYLEQTSPDYDNSPYPDEAVKWDTFTMWRLLNKKPHSLKVGEFPKPDAKWNFVIGYSEEELGQEDCVIFHYTIASEEIALGEIYSA